MSEAQPAATSAPLPKLLPIAPRGPLDAVVRVPGSKSLSNRALVAAALARGESRLSGLLASEDIEVMRVALAAMGAAVEPLGDDAWRVAGTGGALRAPAGTLDARASGTAARFLTAVAALAPGPSVLDGTPRLRERPIGDLAEALGRLGARVEVLGQGGCPPVRIAGGGIAGGQAAVDARRSSQTVSALLLAAPYARADVELALVEGALVSRPYVELTLQVMREFGAEAGWVADDRLRVRAGIPYSCRDYGVEPDASSAAYFFCAAAIAGGRVRVPGLRPDSAQADLGLLEVLARMGCRVGREADGVVVEGPRDGLAGVDVDMNSMPDAVLALAVTAAFARGPSRIRNVAHLRIKESDRLAALERELGKLGCRARATADALELEPAALHGAEIDTWDDHRMAMAFALAGLRVPGVAIRDPACVAKSWPSYFDALARL
jgi:3-phosphoshikimate 1-carboxyvinyltransferase